MHVLGPHVGGFVLPEKVSGKALINSETKPWDIVLAEMVGKIILLPKSQDAGMVKVKDVYLAATVGGG